MTEILNELVILVMCHCIGDYVLQIDFIAKTKGKNWYHLFVHVVLYCVPFAVCYGVDWRLLIIGVPHIAIDAFKARYHIINYVTDQLLHYALLLVYLL